MAGLRFASPATAPIHSVCLLASTIAPSSVAQPTNTHIELVRLAYIAVETCLCLPASTARTELIVGIVAGVVGLIAFLVVLAKVWARKQQNQGYTVIQSAPVAPVAPVAPAVVAYTPAPVVPVSQPFVSQTTVTYQSPQDTTTAQVGYQAPVTAWTHSLS